MSKRRHRGIFDPDYRREGWNQSIFAPKNSPFSITQVASLLALMLFGALYAIPFTRPMFFTAEGLLGGLFIFYTSWIIFGILIRRFEGRRISQRLRSDQPAEETTAISNDTEPIEELPKTDPIKAQIQARKESLRGAIEQQTMHWQDFEHEVAWLINVTTDQKAIVTGGAGDGGVDIKVYSGKRLVGIVQCKRYDPNSTLPPGYIRELYAAKQQHGVRTAYLVTTARFGAQAHVQAKALGIQLIDGEKLIRMRKNARFLVKGHSG